MAKKTVIEIYPKLPKPRWLKVGVMVECLGEGLGNTFEVVEIDTKLSRAAIRHSYGDCWESWGKLSFASAARRLRVTSLESAHPFPIAHGSDLLGKNYASVVLDDLCPESCKWCRDLLARCQSRSGKRPGYSRV